MIKETTFKLVRLSSAFQFSKMMIDPKMSITPIDDDYIRDTLTARLDTYIAAHTTSKIGINKIVPRPKFLDWLLRRERYYHWDVDVMDCLSAPPPTLPLRGDITRLYILQQPPDIEGGE